MSVRIFVLQHAPCDLPECFSDRTIYQPIQCGRALNPKIEGAICDDIGDNISDLNLRYNEATAIYWIGKHYGEIGAPDYIGFDHYRRFLNWRAEWLAPNKVIARRWFSWRPLRGQYACCHDVRNLDIFLSAFRRTMAPEYDDLDLYWRTHFFYICNMFIMDKTNFARYSDFFAACIGILRTLESKGSFYVPTDSYQKRFPGFILETMTSYWLWHEKRAGRICIVNSTVEHFRVFRGFLWRLRQAY